MKVCPTLICFLLLSLLDGNTGLINGKVYSGIKGEDVTVKCSLSSSGHLKIFCKDKCEADDVLIQTTGNRAETGRYSIRYEGGFVSGGDLSVTITQLTSSDSGQYRCGLGEFLSTASYEDVEIMVADALLNDPAEKPLLFTRTGGNLRVACSFALTGSFKFLCKNKCEGKNILVVTHEDKAQKDKYSIRYLEISATKVFLLVTITQLTESDSGLYRCSLDRSSHRDFTISVTDAPSTSEPILAVQPVTSAPSALTQTTDQSDGQTQRPGGYKTLVITLTLVVIIILLSVAVLILCRKRASKSKEPPVETEYASVTEPGRVYEEIREEDRQGVSSVYSYAKYTQPNRVENNDEYSLATVPTSEHKAEDDSSHLSYTEVDFSNGTTESSSSAPRGNTSDVVYSEPKESSDGSLTKDNPLYSAVTAHQ
ncbi:uncharacterized protein LOC108879742 isoform X2 [Lates calcarifer]|uniref:Uncharacterized protein LOC108879742 isoform X2 n=1 Tax=Lates calcarifer TaxID=8187 RepID=A0AAJ8DQK5_LATCA|nr:uncharacterized protein LOC108879742 isoform X2 [Lates calcarifer]